MTTLDARARGLVIGAVVVLAAVSTLLIGASSGALHTRPATAAATQRLALASATRLLR
jgi:hypothetical protein